MGILMLDGKEVDLSVNTFTECVSKYTETKPFSPEKNQTVH